MEIEDLVLKETIEYVEIDPSNWAEQLAIDLLPKLVEIDIDVEYRN